MSLPLINSTFSSALSGKAFHYLALFYQSSTFRVTSISLHFYFCCSFSLKSLSLLCLHFCSSKSSSNSTILRPFSIHPEKVNSFFYILTALCCSFNVELLKICLSDYISLLDCKLLEDKFQSVFISGWINLNIFLHRLMQTNFCTDDSCISKLTYCFGSHILQDGGSNCFDF